MQIKHNTRGFSSKFAIVTSFFGFILATSYLLLASTVFAQFTGPNCNPPNCGGAIGIDSSKNVSIGTSTTQTGVKLLIVASSTATTDYAIKVIQPNLGPVMIMRNDGSIAVGTTTYNGLGTITAVGNISTAGVFSGTLAASNLSTGVFNGATGGNYAVNGSLGVGTTTNTSLPQTLSVYGTGYMSGTAGTNVTLNVATGSVQIGSNVLTLQSVNSGATINVNGFSNMIGLDNSGRISLGSVPGGISGSAPVGSLKIGGLLYLTSSTIYYDGLNNGQGFVFVPNLGMNSGSVFAVQYMQTSTPATALTVSYIGNVGIATTSPGYNLAVQGNIFASGNITCSGSCGGPWSTSGTAIYYSGGNVGIGTSNPVNKLEVGAGGNLLVNGGNIYLIDTNAGVTRTSGTNVAVAANTGERVDLKTGATTGLSVNAGNVGVGTTNPGVKFQVVGTHSYFADTTGNNILDIGDSGSVAFINSTANASGTQGPLIFQMGQVEKMRLDTTGNVGIGTSSPAYALDVVGSIRASGSLFGTFAGTVPAANINSGNIAASTGGGNFSFPGALGIGTSSNVGLPQTLSVYGQIGTSGGSADGTLNGQGVVINDTGWGSNSGLWKIVSKNNVQGLAFYDNTAAAGDFSTNVVPLFLQHSTGNIGVGTSSPATLFTVATSTNIFNVLSNGTVGIKNGSPIYAVQISSAPVGTVALGVTPSSMAANDIGIYMNAPAVLGDTYAGDFEGNNSGRTILQVKNNRTGSSTADAVLSVTSGGATGGSPYASYCVSGVRCWQEGIDNSDGQKFKISANSDFATARLTIATSGNVGIGTTAPNAFLAIQGTPATGNPLLSLQSNADVGTGVPFIKILSSSGGTMFAINENNGNSGGIMTGVTGINGLSSLTLSSAVNGDPSAINVASQNLTIGYLSGVNTFISSYSVPLIFQTNANTERMRIGLNGGVSVGTTTWNATDPGAGNLVIQNNVGIGTSSPAYALDVVGSIRASGSLLGNFAGTVPAANVTAGTFASGNFAFQSSLGIATSSNASLPQPLSVYGNGYISGSLGVGTTAPGQKLDVNGNVNLSSTTSNTIFYGTAGVAAPGAGSLGEKIQLYGTAGTIGASDYAIGIESGNMWFNTASGFKWYVNSATPVMATDVNGNFGVGLTAPGARFQVTSGNDGNTGMILSSSVSNVGSGVGLEFTYGGGSSGGSRIARILPYTESGGGGDLLFQTSPDAATAYSTKMAILRNGNVGIGTSTPSEVLTLSNATRGLIRFDKSGTSIGFVGNENALFTAGSASNLGILSAGSLSLGSDNSATAVLVVKSGDVGVGTTAPSSWLEVAGNSAATGFGGNPNGAQGINVVNTHNTTGTPVGIEFSAYKNGTNAAYTHSGIYGVGTNLSGSTVGDILFASRHNTGDTAFTENLRVVGSSGNVGIGTSTPNALLSVGNNTTGTVAIFGGGTGKIVAGTVDPLYAINGENFATYAPGMTGQKEETTGLFECPVKNGECAYTINFASLDKASDLWLFAKTTNLKNNFNQMAVMLSPAFSGNVWYEKDTKNLKLTIHGDVNHSNASNVEISYRLSAPRFDAASWPNIAPDSETGGFIINE